MMMMMMMTSLGTSSMRRLLGFVKLYVYVYSPNKQAENNQDRR